MATQSQDTVVRRGRVWLTSGFSPKPGGGDHGTDWYPVREYADGYLEYYLTGAPGPDRWVTLGEQHRDRIIWDA